MKFNLFTKKQPQEQEDKKQMREKIIAEFIRQTQLTFNLALGVSTASAIITLLGVGLFYLDKIPEASLTAGGGIVFSIGSVQFAKETRKELEEILESLDDE
ncbi:hypothetical protein SR1949_39490 [Sphaerospermopsis reniformis]|uniref:Cyanobacterial TRADD-N associated 2 transmembrane domain-containing protein n=1 Tax=Sphaerospermopsis reniformis TaxID=531300 RepID=A0A480A1E4_9CYAN|nr:hypothetical protein [Sphaerospermopsis reniformis]GCL38830.1 hypothetical protein SR1949_39490 [Sphaerospermopsis reniformis]